MNRTYYATCGNCGERVEIMDGIADYDLIVHKKDCNRKELREQELLRKIVEGK